MLDEDFLYFSLVRKSDNKEVYTSIGYTRDNSEVFDFRKIINTLEYYFTRVNSGIEQQLKRNADSGIVDNDLKLLSKDDYVVKMKKFTPIGIAEKVLHTYEATKFMSCLS